ncbi:hypothetical protein J7K27_02430 [Candidatus Bathyarchaeota archaeon]|nr:hypothetical protein [Candidatus Bathyarchaeota archaeon]
MAVARGERISKVERNLRDRADACRRAADRERDVISSARAELREIKPLQAIITLRTGTRNNIGQLLKDQCEITRRWIPL